MNMQERFILMDKTTGVNIYRETRFRSPHRAERQLGLWIDRIGAASYTASAGEQHRSSSDQQRNLRLLGQYAVVVIDSGGGNVYTGKGESQAVAAMDVILLSPRVPIAYEAEPSWYSRWIVWNGPEADNLCQLGYFPVDIPILRGAGSAVTKAYFALLQLMPRDDLAASLARKNVVGNMILELYQARSLPAQAGAGAGVAAGAVEFINRHYMLELDIQTLAREFGQSPTHFRRVFKSHTGCSPKEFLTSVRLSRAKELLSAGSTIKQVAAAVGYSDFFYFMRIFKEHTGMPPGKFAARSSKI